MESANEIKILTTPLETLDDLSRCILEQKKREMINSATENENTFGNVDENSEKDETLRSLSPNELIDPFEDLIEMVDYK